MLEQEKQYWAKAMISLLLEAKTAIEKEGRLRADAISRFAARYDRILELGFMEDAKQNPPAPSPKENGASRSKVNRKICWIG